MSCSKPRYHLGTHTFLRDPKPLPIKCGKDISEYPYVNRSTCGRVRGHTGPHMRYPNKVETRDQTVTVHDESKCLNEKACVIHNPSAHKMVDWTMTFRPDRMWLVERTCTHGVGHPDPDSVMYFVQRDGYDKYAMWSHGCDGCCV